MRHIDRFLSLKNLKNKKKGSVYTTELKSKPLQEWSTSGSVLPTINTHVSFNSYILPQYFQLKPVFGEHNKLTQINIK